MRVYRTQLLFNQKHGDGWFVVREENGVETRILGPYIDADQAKHIAHQLNGRIARVVEQLARNSEIRREAMAGA